MQSVEGTRAALLCVLSPWTSHEHLGVMDLNELLPLTVPTVVCVLSGLGTFQRAKLAATEFSPPLKASPVLIKFAHLISR